MAKIQLGNINFKTGSNGLRIYSNFSGSVGDEFLLDRLTITEVD